MPEHERDWNPTMVAEGAALMQRFMRERIPWADRIGPLRALALKYPLVGWEEAVREAEYRAALEDERRARRDGDA